MGNKNKNEGEQVTSVKVYCKNNKIINKEEVITIFLTYISISFSCQQFALDLENMRWELTTNRKYNSTFNDSEIIDDQDSKEKL